MSEALRIPVEFDEASVEEPTDEAILAKLKSDIEALSENQPLWSRSAYTPRRTIHRIFVNGVLVREGETYLYPTENLAKLAEMTLIAVKAYRQSIVGDVDLVWRAEPEVKIVDGGKVTLYTRLCFEPVLEKVADGVWVERRHIRNWTKF